MANRIKGECDITLGGGTYTLQLTYTAMIEIEESLGCGVFELFARAAAGVFTLKDMAVIVHAAVKIQKDDTDLSVEQIGEMILLEGATNLIEPIGAFFRNAINGGVKKSLAQTRKRQTK